MASAVDRLFVELRWFFEPLSLALESPEDLAAFLRRFGYDFDDVAGAVDELAPARDAALQLADTTSSAVENGVQLADVVAIVSAAAPLFDALRTMRQSLAGLATPGGMTPQAFADSLETLPAELFDVLLTDFLGTRAPLALHTLAFLDVVHTEPVPESGDPRSRGVEYELPTYRWDRIGLLFDDASEWAKQAYGWGVAFESDTFIFRLTRIFEYLGGMAEIREMSQVQAAIFLPHMTTSPVRPHIALAPLHRSRSAIDSPTGPIDAVNEVGIALLPVADAAAPQDAGIALAPYTEGTVAQDIPFGDRTTLALRGAIGALGGIVFSFRPSGARTDVGVDATAFAGDFSAELVVSPADGRNTIVLIGDPASTRVEVDAVIAGVGGSASSTGADFFVTAGVRALHVVVDASSDGLLGSILGGPIEVDAGDLLVGWRSGRGLYFEGGTGISVTIPIDKQLGPFHLYDIGIAVDWKDALDVTGTVTADARLGPLYAYVEGLGLTATLVPASDGDGTFGKFDIAFGLVLPKAYAVALDAAPISGGGFLAVLDNEYRGALALKFESFGFAAFAILNTTLPGGRPGFSFVASIFGDFVIPLGYGFFLTGLGGVIGINRTVDTDALRQVLYEGELDSVLFPADPIVNAATILDNMAAILPAREGQYVFGPMARIAFSQPPLIEGKLGIVLEVGREFRLLVLGALGSKLPTRDAPLVALEVMFFGEIDFGAGTISFDATLERSYILAWPVSGDMAARTGWAPRIDHVVSFGGLHPQYPRPSNLPDLRRMSISFGTNNPRVSLWAYAAVTLNSLQFGAGGDLYAKGPKIPFVGRLAADGHAYFDALVYFNPFAFDAALGGSLSLLVDGDVVLSLGFDLRLTGPNEFVIDGKVWASVCGIDVDFGIHHTWGDRRELPAAVADPIAILRDAIAASTSLEPIAAAALSDGVRFASPAPDEDGPRPASPVGGLRFSQRAMPLGIAIEKIGEADIVGANRTFDLAVFAGATAIAATPARLDFVRGHFWKSTEAERLRAPSFELHKSGFEVAAGDRLTVDITRAIDVEYGYEYMNLGDEADATASPLLPFATLGDAVVARWMGAHQREQFAPLDRVAVVAPAADAPTISSVRFTPVARAGAIAEPLARAQALADAPIKRRNPVVAAYVPRRG